MNTFMKIILVLLVVYLGIGVYNVVIDGAPQYAIVNWGYCWIDGFIDGGSKSQQPSIPAFCDW